MCQSDKEKQEKSERERQCDRECAGVYVIVCVREKKKDRRGKRERVCAKKREGGRKRAWVGEQRD